MRFSNAKSDHWDDLLQGGLTAPRQALVALSRGCCPGQRGDAPTRSHGWHPSVAVCGPPPAVPWARRPRTGRYCSHRLPARGDVNGVARPGSSAFANAREVPPPQDHPNVPRGQQCQTPERRRSRHRLSPSGRASLGPQRDLTSARVVALCSP